jgi:hypothetical protein
VTGEKFNERAEADQSRLTPVFVFWLEDRWCSSHERLLDDHAAAEVVEGVITAA